MVYPTDRGGEGRVEPVRTRGEEGEFFAFYGPRQRGQGGSVLPLDFHTWYRYSRERLNSANFWSFRCPSPHPLEERGLIMLFSVFSVEPPWKFLVLYYSLSI